MTKGLGRANMNLQLNEWAYQYFLGAVTDEDTVQALEYLDLIKRTNIETPGSHHYKMS